MSEASRRNFLAGVAAGAVAGSAGLKAETASPANKAIPTVALGNHRVTRLILGGNPIRGFSHSVQKLSDLMREYFTVPRITDLIMHAEEEGINTFQMSYDPKIAAALNAARERGSNMQWICLTHAGDESILKDILALKPIAIAHHGNRTDEYFQTDRRQQVRDYVKKVHDLGLLAGISTHCPKHVAMIEDLGWENDFYMTCLYYLTRTPDELKLIYGDALVNVREEPFVKGDPERMAKQIRATKKTCLAFKILAAGRNCMNAQNVEDCFRFAYQNIKPTDAVIVGMYPVLNDEVRIDADLGRKYSRPS
jgi:hypothetical protein